MHHIFVTFCLSPSESAEHGPYDVCVLPSQEDRTEEAFMPTKQIDFAGWAILCAAVACFSLSCGGGGSDSQATEFYGGTWAGRAALLKNTCPFTPLDSFDFIHTVNQRDLNDGTSHMVLEDGTHTFEGSTDIAEPREFTVVHATNLSPGAMWFRQGAWTYFEIAGDFAEVVGVLLFQRAQGGGSIEECDVAYAASATRQPAAPSGLVPVSLNGAVPAAQGDSSDTETQPSPSATPQNSCSACDLRGCCANHRGVASCRGDGSAVICNDGTSSPTCVC
jgi:hypothetical protein